jgi:two-component system, response regulator PdtaR
MSVTAALRPKDAKQTRSKILVVEDEVLIRMMIADALRYAGCAVVEAASADEAVDVLRTTADVGLVFSDMRMPGYMDGVALAQLVRSQYPAVKVVLSSGQLSVDWAEHDGFFRKPYDLARVTKHIKSLIG